jgi:hypothetical protein
MWPAFDSRTENAMGMNADAENRLTTVIDEMEKFVRKLQVASDGLRDAGEPCTSARVESAAVNLRDACGGLEELLEGRP